VDTKRCIDICGAAILLTWSWPLLAAGAIWSRHEHGTSSFKQPRTGRGGNTFIILKLRTMSPDREPRLPSRVMRRSGLDELPSLINVLKGEMSLVGPRPLVVDVWPRLDDRQRHRHRVRPGLTGWAQIRGRWSSRFSERIERDLWYVQHASPALDAAILLATPCVLAAHLFRSERPLEDVDDLPMKGATAK
jgi:lipopolysaccharide/colanic/teichoic acid biosynthesis glycosyltransferase